MLSGDQLSKKLLMWEARAKALEEKSARNNGMIKRQELWEREYYQAPYLTAASNEYIHNRFIDHFHNNVRLTAEGQIAPHYESTKDDGLLMPLFAHLHLELGTRGGLPAEVVRRANEELDKYFERDVATGVVLFRDLPERMDNVIVKFGKAEHLAPMLRDGTLRLTPADFYSRGSLLKAMRDLETQREFHIPQFNAIVAGKTTITVGGFDTKLEDGFLKLTVQCPEYLMWSACRDVDRRLADDFGANASLIIRDPIAFSTRLRHKVKEIWPSAAAWHGPVEYYDPCSFVAQKRRPETIKHFSFYYQREWKFCAFPYDAMPSEPYVMSIGDLRDIAQLVTLPT
jgi:hypothetical protein